MLGYYPKDLHLRTIKPPVFSSYKRYKSFLREEFSGICVYCRTPDVFLSPMQYGVDHYLPKSKYPEIASKYENLFYACNECNLLKGDFDPGEYDSEQLFIPNPCDHSMAAHLRLNFPDVVHRSRHGDFTIRLLRLNEESRCKLRRLRVKILRGQELLRLETLKALKEAKKRVSVSGDTELFEAISRLQAELEEINSFIKEADA